MRSNTEDYGPSASDRTGFKGPNHNNDFLFDLIIFHFRITKHYATELHRMAIESNGVWAEHDM